MIAGGGIGAWGNEKAASSGYAVIKIFLNCISVIELSHPRTYLNWLILILLPSSTQDCCRTETGSGNDGCPSSLCMAPGGLPPTSWLLSLVCATEWKEMGQAGEERQAKGTFISVAPHCWVLLDG